MGKEVIISLEEQLCELRKQHSNQIALELQQKEDERNSKKIADEIMKQNIASLNEELEEVRSKLNTASKSEERIEALQVLNNSSVAEVSKLKQDIEKLTAENEDALSNALKTYSNETLELQRKLTEALNSITERTEKISELKSFNVKTCRENAEE